MKKLLILLIALVLLSACGAGSPSGPVMLPTTVEYMGETVGGDVAVQTGKMAAFAVTDADGNPADASLLTVQFTDINGGTLAAYAIPAAADSQLQLVQPSRFPNTESQYVANFFYGDTLLNTVPIKVSVSEEDQQSDRYTFTDQMLVYDGTWPAALQTNITQDNILFTCYGDVFASGETTMSVSRKLDAYSTSFEGPFTAIQYDGITTTLNTGICDVTAIDSAIKGNETVAVAWLAYDKAYNSDCGVVNGCKNYYHYVQFSNDGGRIFGTPVLVHHVNMFKSVFLYPNTISIKFDQSGLLHVAYVSSADAQDLNLYYTNCTQDSCNSGTQVNSVSNSLALSWNTNTPIDVYNNSDGSVAIYTAWMDDRNRHLIPPGAPYAYEYSQDLYAAKLLKTGATIEVQREARVNSNPDVRTYQADLVIDREGNPVFTWWQARYSREVANLDNRSYLAKSFDGLTTVRNSIPLMSEAEMETHFAFLPRMAVDFSNYYHITFVSGDYTPGGGWADTFDVKYVMASYQYSDSGTDTLDALPARNIISDQVIDSMRAIDTINDAAGRAYLILAPWPDGTTLMGVEGNIFTTD